MKTKLKDLWGKVKGFFAKLNKKIRILLGVAVAVILIATAVVVYQMNNQPYAVLFTGLSATETSSIMSYLETNGIVEYQIRGESILVPQDQEATLKTKLLLEGYPKSGYLYESYFNNVSSMSSASERNTALLIATQERLEATICSFVGVKSATVNINPGKDQTYVLDTTDKVNASAWVNVEMHGGYTLTREYASAIRNAVSHAIQGLTIDNVTITDNYGNTYSGDDNMSSLSDGSALKLRLEEQTNNTVRTNVLQALMDIYGPNNVRVAVSSVVDVSRKFVESTEYSQPAGAAPNAGLIGSETWLQQVVKENTDAVGGVVGTTNNSDIPTYVENELELNGDENYVGSSGDRDYDTNKQTTQTEVIAGTISDIHISVTINRNSDNANAVSEATLLSHVAMASGIGSKVDPKEHISIVIAPFYDPSLDVFVPDGIQLPSWTLYALAAGLALFLILLILILFLRKRSKKKKAEQAAAEAAAANEQLMAEMAAATVAAGNGDGADIMALNMEKSMELRKTVRQFAQTNPEIAALIIKNWLKGDED